MGRWLVIYGVLRVLETLAIEPSFGARCFEESREESSSRAHYLWGAIRGDMPAGVGKDDVGGPVLDFEHCRRASHPWMRWYQMQEELSAVCYRRCCFPCDFARFLVLFAAAFADCCGVGREQIVGADFGGPLLARERRFVADGRERGGVDLGAGVAGLEGDGGG